LKSTAAASRVKVESFSRFGIVKARVSNVTRAFFFGVRGFQARPALSLPTVLIRIPL